MTGVKYVYFNRCEYECMCVCVCMSCLHAFDVKGNGCGESGYAWYFQQHNFSVRLILVLHFSELNLRSVVILSSLH